MELITPTNILLTILTLLVGVLGYLLKDKLAKIDNIDKTTRNIRHNLIVIIGYLVTHKDFDSHRDLLVMNSPISLTREAKTLLLNTGFADIFRDYQSWFFDFINEENATTKFDIQNASIKSIYASMTQEFMGPIKSYLYNNPKVDQANFFYLAGVYIRDSYLDLHQEITK